MIINKILVTEQDHVHLLSLNEIKFCQSDDCYTIIHVNNGSKYMVTKSLVKFSKELNSQQFIRVNQSYLVNINFIKSINKKKKHITIDNTDPIPFTLTIRELLLLINLVTNQAGSIAI